MATVGGLNPPPLLLSSSLLTGDGEGFDGDRSGAQGAEALHRSLSRSDTSPSLMAPNSTTITNGATTATKGPSPGCLSSIYSEVQMNRLNHDLPLPSILKSPFKIIDAPPSSTAGNPDEIVKLFPNLFRQPSMMLVPTGSIALEMTGSLKIGIVLSGMQAPGGHNVISGIFDERAVTLLAFLPFSLSIIYLCI